MPSLKTPGCLSDVALSTINCALGTLAPIFLLVSFPFKWPWHYDCDVVYFDLKTHKRIVLEISRVAITRASISGSGVLAGPGEVPSIPRARERERRRCARISAIAEHDEGNNLFIPDALTSCGGFGLSAQKYFRHICGRARENSCSDMGVGQPTIQTTWNTLHASTYWNMRLSVAGWCLKGRASPERHFAVRLHPQSCRGWPRASPRSGLRVVRASWAPPSPCCGASASCLRTFFGPTSWALECCCFASFQERD